MLIGIKQKENESLREFITRFNATTLEVIDLDPMVAMSAMKDNLKPSRFLFSLEKWFFASFVEMLFWAEKYANVEKAKLTKRTSTPSPSDEKEKEKKKEKRKREEPPSQDRSN